MEILPTAVAVSVRDLLPNLGFDEVWGGFAEREPSFRYVGGGIDITVTEVTNLYMQRVLAIGGVASNPRQFGMIEFDLGLTVESREQLLAFLAYTIGAVFKPTAAVPWLDQGRNLQHLLPWERDLARRQAQALLHDAARAARPHCKVARAWMRLIGQSLRTLATEGGADHGAVVVSFDGRLITFATPDETFAAPARGDSPWPISYEVPIAECLQMPKRLMADPVTVGIWQDCLEIDRATLALAMPASSSAQAG